jgi:large subunit ribosomal protein L24
MAPSARPRRHTRVPDLRSGDTVLVLTGKDAGKRGVIQRVVRHQQGWGRSTERFGAGWQDRAPLTGAAVVVEGLNVAKRHTKPRAVAGRTDRQPRVQQGGILDIPQPIAMSNVMLVCPNCAHPTRVRHASTTDGRSVRSCTQCGETISTRVEARKK